MTRKLLLLCGILSSLLYIAMNIFVPMLYDGYDSASQTVSELSAIDAPTGMLWVLLGTVYTILIICFGWGIWQSPFSNFYLRKVGIFLFFYGIISLLWPLAPMHQREVLAAGGATISDTLHIVMTIVTVTLMLTAIGFGAAALGNGFRGYSVLTILVLVVFGALTASQASGIEANLPTPMAGVWERISIGAFLLWVIVLGVILLRIEKNEVYASTLIISERK